MQVDISCLFGFIGEPHDDWVLDCDSILRSDVAGIANDSAQRGQGLGQGQRITVVR